MGLGYMWDPWAPDNRSVQSSAEFQHNDSEESEYNGPLMELVETKQGLL